MYLCLIAPAAKIEFLTFLHVPSSESKTSMVCRPSNWFFLHACAKSMNEMINVTSIKRTADDFTVSGRPVRSHGHVHLFHLFIYQHSIARVDAFDIDPVFYMKLASCVKKASDANRLTSGRAVAVRQSRVRKIHVPTTNKLYKYLKRGSIARIALAIYTNMDGTRCMHRWGQNLHLPRQNMRLPIGYKLSCTVCEWIALKITRRPRECNYTHFVHWLTVPNSLPVVFLCIRKRPSKIVLKLYIAYICSWTASACTRRHRRRRHNENEVEFHASEIKMLSLFFSFFFSNK